MNRLNNIYNKIAITKALIQYIFNRRILHVRFMDDKTFNFIFTNTIIVLLPPPAPSHFLFNHRTRTNLPVSPSSRMENRISSADSQASERLNRNDERRETGSGSAASSLLGKNLVCANFDSCSQAKRSELPEE